MGQNLSEFLVRPLQKSKRRKCAGLGEREKRDVEGSGRFEGRVRECSAR